MASLFQVLLLIMSTASLVAKFKWAHHPGGYGLPASHGKEVHVHLHGQTGSYQHSPPAIFHYDDWTREDKVANWEPPGAHQPGMAVHQVGHPLVRKVHGHMESTPSPWASYIGDQTL